MDDVQNDPLSCEVMSTIQMSTEVKCASCSWSCIFRIIFYLREQHSAILASARSEAINSLYSRPFNCFNHRQYQRLNDPQSTKSEHLS